MLPSILERKFFAVESKFFRILSIVASYMYVKSKGRASYNKIIIRLRFCDIQNNQGLSKGN